MRTTNAKLLMALWVMLVALAANDQAVAGTIGVNSLDSNRWEEVVGMPASRDQFAAATYNGSIYVIGGSGAPTNAFRFDGTSWTSIPSPVDYGRLGAAVLGDFLYAVGTFTNTYSYDGTNWSAVVGMPAAREWLGAATLGANLYAIGGGHYTTNVYAFNGTAWTEVEGLNRVGSSPFGTIQLAASDLDGKIYAIGGSAWAPALQTFRCLMAVPGPMWQVCRKREDVIPQRPSKIRFMPSREGTRPMDLQPTCMFSMDQHGRKWSACQPVLRITHR
jgi:hypothetical protein